MSSSCTAVTRNIYRDHRVKITNAPPGILGAEAAANAFAQIDMAQTDKTRRWIAPDGNSRPSLSMLTCGSCAHIYACHTCCSRIS